ncbi:nucleoside triphosphate pyrophosphohydrolase [Myxococcota bacterium]|nr:nucleoside triphosphate pyrophosphohydrolase [Myxococcota bacterium]MBU1410927.1 nucleoside triphosphate pyrophosphohydrolase [Myxococcota bacterium]MBU1510381.1 nucleoside triphosphate pyrophosphohydrolase [Myxococcota bacterium]
MPTDHEGAGVAQLVDVVRTLLGPSGCEWDRAQTLSTLRTYLLEETYELVEAMEKSPEAHREELGDMMFQIVFQCAIREQEGLFALDDAARGVAEKLVRRHPHVWGPGNTLAGGLSQDRVARMGQGERGWESLKVAEKRKSSLMDDIPPTLPALMESEKIQRRAASAGFDWPDREGPRRKVDEELVELEEAVASGDPDRIEDELGDVLFALVNLARHVHVAPELALRRASRKFAERFRNMEQFARADGKTLYEMNLDDLDALWVRAKEI